ncbi:oxidoreductase [Devosia soli]|uniref:Oxidoreductase n=1 Tax=Devosia soli TaxID=361041 RepID=A0A0F5L3B3_9HYPH|nr:alpha/beta hydrolase [Devosia soli]KKB76097.1 oxidoreductase [Devosia soli]
MLRSLTIAATLVMTTIGAQAQAEPKGDYAEVNGMRMYYEVSGEGAPIVVLHGAYMNIPAMGDIIPTLAKTHKVYALEFQGHGRTEDIDRPVTYPNLASDVAAFMDEVGLEKADILGYSMGAAAGLRLAIDHPDKVDHLITASVSYDMSGSQPAFLEMIPTMVPDMFVGTPMEEAWKQLAPNPDGFRPFVERLIALEHEPMAWGNDVEKLKMPVLIIAGDADMMTLEHLVSMFRLLGGGEPGDMGKPLGASRLAILPASSHTAVIGQVDLLMGIIEPFLKGEAPKGMFDQ